MLWLVEGGGKVLQEYLHAVRLRLASLGFGEAQRMLPGDLRPFFPLVLGRGLDATGAGEMVAVTWADGRSAAERARLVELLAAAVGTAADPPVGVAVGAPARVLLVHCFAGELTARELDATDSLPRGQGDFALTHWIVDLETAALLSAGGGGAWPEAVRTAIDPMALWRELQAQAARRAVAADGTGDVSGAAIRQRVEQPWLTYAVLAVIGLIFMQLEASGGSTNVVVLRQWGAKYAPYIVQRGESWRLLTSVFLHGGFGHVMLNSLALYQLGRLVEGLFGRWRYGLIFLLAGVAGSLASLLLGHPAATGVGASGAIFGLFGALIYLRMAAPRAFPVRWTQLLMPVAINLMVGIAIPQVDNWAHLGGLMGGTLAAAALGVRRPMAAWRWLATVLLVGAAVLLVLGWLPMRPLAWPGR